MFNFSLSYSYRNWFLRILSVIFKEICIKDNNAFSSSVFSLSFIRLYISNDNPIIEIIPPLAASRLLNSLSFDITCLIEFITLEESLKIELISNRVF